MPDNAEGRAFRELPANGRQHAGCARRATCSRTPLIVRDRVREYNGIEVEPLYPPLGGDTTRFFTDEYGEFIFFPSRVTSIKRQLLAVQALRVTPRRRCGS